MSRQSFVKEGKGEKDWELRLWEESPPAVRAGEVAATSLKRG